MSYGIRRFGGEHNQSIQLRRFGVGGAGRDGGGFAKVPDAAADALAALIAEGARVDGVRYTPTTVALLRAVVAAMCRKSWIARASYEALMASSGIRSRSTMAGHLRLLEAAGLVVVERGTASRTRRKINRIHAVGALLAGLSGRHTVQSSNGNQIWLVGWDREISHIVKSFGVARQVLDALIAEKGAARVIAVARWVDKQHWAKNRAALLVHKVRAGFDPAAVGRTPPAAYEAAGVDDLRAEVDDETWRAEMAARREGLAAGVDDPADAVDDEAWQMARRQLELQFDRATWATWLKPLALVEVDGGRRYTLKARDERHAGKVRDMARNIRRMLADALGVRMDEVFLETVA